MGRPELGVQLIEAGALVAGDIRRSILYEGEQQSDIKTVYVLLVVKGRLDGVR